MSDGNQYQDDFLADMAPALAEQYRQWYPWCRATVLDTIDRIGTRDFLERALATRLSEQQLDLLRQAWFEPYRGYHTRSGKMLRPVLVCMVMQAFGRDPRALPAVVAMAEIIHAASLVLDDIADDSPLRRGGPTAHQLVGVRVAGASASAWLNACFELLRDGAGLASEQAATLIDELAWEHWVTGLGTTIDTAWPWMNRFDRTPEEYLQSVVHRSTSYTYRMPLKIGAVAAGANAAEREQLAAFGEELGLAFQIIDDILNVQPGDDRWGKAVAEDVTQGKINLQVLLALRQLPVTGRDRLISLLQSRTSDAAELAEAVQLMQESGAFGSAREIAMAHVQRTKALVADMHFLPQGSRDCLSAFVDYVICRSR